LKTENEKLKFKKIRFFKKKKKEINSQLNLISKSRNMDKEEIPNMQINQQKCDISENKINIESLNNGNQSNKEGQIMEIEESKKERINYNYGICDILVSSFFCCFMTKKLKLKKELNVKAINLLNNKLDIFLFVKNMILIDIMNQILLKENKESLTHFLSKPVISLRKEKKDNKNKKFNETVFDEFYNEMMKFVKKPEIVDNEKEIIAILNKKLKELI